MSVIPSSPADIGVPQNTKLWTLAKVFIDHPKQYYFVEDLTDIYGTIEPTMIGLVYRMIFILRERGLPIRSHSFPTKGGVARVKYSLSPERDPATPHLLFEKILSVVSELNDEVALSAAQIAERLQSSHSSVRSTVSRNADRLPSWFLRGPQGYRKVARSLL